MLPLVCVLACGGGQEDTAGSSSQIADERAVRDLVSSFDKAVNSRDIEALMARYADHAVRMEPNTPMLVGRHAMASSRLIYLSDRYCRGGHSQNHCQPTRLVQPVPHALWLRLVQPPGSRLGD